MDFLKALQILVLVGGAVVIPVAAYAAFAATRAIWIKGIPQPDSSASDARLAELEARIVELEQGQAQLAELEERLDFTERLLAQQREPAQIEKP
jgi:Tfp pilus assembly protein PilO